MKMAVTGRKFSVPKRTRKRAEGAHTSCSAMQCGDAAENAHAKRAECCWKTNDDNFFYGAIGNAKMHPMLSSPIDGAVVRHSGVLACFAI